MSENLGKSYLLETIVSAFNEDILPEVKLNLPELHQYFDNKGETFKTLLNVIQQYDSNRITKLIISDALSQEANRSEEEIDNILSRISKARRMNPDEIDKMKKRFRDICYRTVTERARIEAQDDSEKYSEIIKNYEYKDLGTSNFIIKNINDLDSTQLTEKYLNHPVRSSIDFINSCFPLKAGYLLGSIGIVCGKPKSGKSMFMMQECVYMAKQGLNCLYVALGDLNELDFLVRMAAIETGTAIDIVYSDVETYRKRMQVHVDGAGGRIDIVVMAAGELTPSEFVTIATNKLKDFYKVIFLDYDLNFQSEIDNQYERGGDLYDKLTQIKNRTNALLMVGTQPNKSYWGCDLLDDSCFIESSKKSMIVDFAVTIGKNPTSGTDCGYMNLPIVRRGTPSYHPYVLSNTGRLVIIPESLYSTIGADPTERHYSLKELEVLCSTAD